MWRPRPFTCEQVVNGVFAFCWQLLADASAVLDGTAKTMARTTAAMTVAGRSLNVSMTCLRRLIRGTVQPTLAGHAGNHHEVPAAVRSANCRSDRPAALAGQAGLCVAGRAGP